VELLPQTAAWGDAFEYWVILEMVKNISYRRLDWQLSYLRTKEGVEIDFIVERPGQPHLLLEIKSKDRADLGDVKALESLGREIDPRAEKWLLSNDPLERMLGSTRAVHWRKGIGELFGL
jgi:hypothetical protein